MLPFTDMQIHAQLQPVSFPEMALAFHKNRREALFQQLPNNSVAIIASGAEQIRNNDVEFPFRANSDFVYLSGFEEPDATLILLKTSEEQTVLLGLRPRDLEKEIWNGRRLGVEAAPDALDVDEAFDNEELLSILAELSEQVEHIFISFKQFDVWAEVVNEVITHCQSRVRQGAKIPEHVSNLDTILHEMRLFKTDYEIEQMRVAAQISVKGHFAAMKHARPQLNEAQLQAVLEAEFKASGSPRVAFNTIVAGGENGCILHYTENNQTLNNNELVLVDAGAEWNGYAGDITHTYPSNGSFSEAQAKIYTLVLNAQVAAIEAVKPGVTYDEIHKASVKVLAAGLIELGLLQGTLDECLQQESYKAFFMHGTGHWLGRDVHDVGAYKKNGEWRPLEAGMVLTVEPGLYISMDAEVEEQWKGIGVRIEDDVLVTKTGHEILTFGLPRTVQEIEQAMSE